MKHLLSIFWRLSAPKLAELELAEAQRQYLIACTNTEDWAGRKRVLEERIRRLSRAQPKKGPQA